MSSSRASESSKTISDAKEPVEESRRVPPGGVVCPAGRRRPCGFPERPVGPRPARPFKTAPDSVGPSRLLGYRSLLRPSLQLPADTSVFGLFPGELVDGGRRFPAASGSWCRGCARLGRRRLATALLRSALAVVNGPAFCLIGLALFPDRVPASPLHSHARREPNNTHRNKTKRRKNKYIYILFVVVEAHRAAGDTLSAYKVFCARRSRVDFCYWGTVSAYVCV